MADPQFGIAKILRPFTGFEGRYQGQTVNIPIVLTEGGDPRDSHAGEPGYDPNLVKGLPVPMGAKLEIWIPILFATQDPLPHIFIESYEWEFVWRLRNTFDYRQTRSAYHYPKQGPGIPDTTAPPGQQARVIIPGAYETVVVAQSIVNNGAPLIVTTPGQAIMPESYKMSPESLSNNPPFMPVSGTGVIQQGILPPPGLPAVPYELPSYGLVTTEAKGDELIIKLFRRGNTTAGNLWKFGANEPDNALSKALGNGTGQTFPDLGVYVMMGVSFSDAQPRQQGAP